MPRLTPEPERNKGRNNSRFLAAALTGDLRVKRFRRLRAQAEEPAVNVRPHEIDKCHLRECARCDPRMQSTRESPVLLLSECLRGADRAHRSSRIPVRARASRQRGRPGGLGPTDLTQSTVTSCFCG